MRPRIPVGDLDEFIAWWKAMREESMSDVQSDLEQTSASLASDFRHRGVDIADTVQRRAVWAAFEIAIALDVSDAKVAAGLFFALSELESANAPIERRPS